MSQLLGYAEPYGNSAYKIILRGEFDDGTAKDFHALFGIGRTQGAGSWALDGVQVLAAE